MQRRKPLKRKKNLRPKVGKPLRRTRVKPSNPARKKREHERSYGEKAVWIRGFPCCACGIGGPIEAAHTASGGMGRKSDSSTLVPLCGSRFVFSIGVNQEGCHAELHRMGIKTFEAKHGISLADQAERYERAWRSEVAPSLDKTNA